MPKKESSEQIIKKVGEILGVEIKKEPIWSWNLFSEKFRYYDQFKREYYAKFSRRKNGFIVKVISPVKNKNFNFKEYPKEFIVRGENVYRKTDIEIILNFIKNFLFERNYLVENFEIKKNYGIKIGRNKILIFENSHIGEIEILKLFPYPVAILKDKNNPYFCPSFHQYIFKFKPEFIVNENFNINIALKDYQETEIKIASFSPVSIIKSAIYGFKSQNLRAFYSEEGIFPEVKHAIRLSLFSTLGLSIVNTSVFVRISEKLKGNTWYTLAAGVLAFIRAPAEIYYMKKSLKLSEHLPSISLQKMLEAKELKKIWESKEVISWYNFEKALTTVLQKKENFAPNIDKYCFIKPHIFKAVEEKNYNLIFTLLEENIPFTKEEISYLSCYIKKLEKVDTKKIIKEYINMVNILIEKKIIKEEAFPHIRHYIENIFPKNFIRYTYTKAFKFLHDRIKQEERTPTKEEISILVSACKKNILPFRVYDLFLFFSIYAMGYSATFLHNLPELVIPAYYIIYGAIANIIMTAFNRFGSQVSLQYIFRYLENTPTIRSAADVWNEYNSHLMRIWAIFSSLGIVLGVLGKIFSAKTYGISRYFVEAIGFILYIDSFKEWYLFYDALEKKSKTGE